MKICCVRWSGLIGMYPKESDYFIEAAEDNEMTTTTRNAGNHCRAAIRCRHGTVTDYFAFVIARFCRA